MNLHDWWSVCGQDLERGKKEAHSFALTVARKLMESDGRGNSGLSSMMAFTRVDVGIMMDENGEAKYFVNEVERTTNTSLWLRHLEPERYPTVALSFARALLRWLSFIDTFVGYANNNFEASLFP